ncbi:LAME_0H16446g1_1 [Lachancea meyersii CBS 8951]|uniref:LAME_0H16446g1_1 n=1 Tax=Lachancea meyersii CBS 8951 TaxID=1266667 RepID=A0A1G4KIE2_9SACH|nr:LAME_0H16446g1_1 [Lachancea meyersii CBS 8951]
MSDLVEPDFVVSGQPSNPFADANMSSLPTSGRGTLDEPITETLKRDLLQINSRLKEVVYPQFPLRWRSAGERNNDPEWTLPDDNGISAVQKDHCADLWAPLLFTIAFSVALSRASDQFSRIFVLSWASLAILAVHLTLGSSKDSGKLAFLTAVSTCGYCFFPQVINAIMSSLLLPLIMSFIGNEPLKFRVLIIARLAIFFGCAFWSCQSCFKASKAESFLDRFPLVQIMLVLNWTCVVA